MYNIGVYLNGKDDMENPKKLQLVLRCIAYPATNGGQEGYYAICIDLNLFTWRSTHKEAVQSLNQAIKGYLDTVTDLAKDEELTLRELEGRIIRPSPFFPHKARYYLYRLLTTLIKNGRNGQTTYKEPVSLPVAHVAA